MASLVGKNILIVDEVDDTRTTLEYAVRELEKDVERKRQELLAEGGEGGETRFFIFVLHVSFVALALSPWRRGGGAAERRLGFSSRG